MSTYFRHMYLFFTRTNARTHTHTQSLKSEIFQQHTSSDPTLVARGQPSEKDKEEIVTQLLEHIVALKMVLQLSFSICFESPKNAVNREIFELINFIRKMFVLNKFRSYDGLR